MQKNGISTEIYSLINNEEIRPSINLVISKCSAHDYLNNAIPNLEKMTVKYYDTFSITSRFTGYISNITIGDFFNDLSYESCGSTAILGGLNSTARKGNSQNSSSSSSSSGSDKNSSSSENSISQNTENHLKQENVVTNPDDLTAGTSSVVGKRGTENIGLAVFNKDKFCGELTAVESICHLLITNNLDSCIIAIDNPMSTGKKIELSIMPKKKSKINIDTKDNKIKISLKISLSANILTLEEGVNYKDKKTLEKISSKTEEYLKKEFEKYLNKISKEYNSDIDHFCTKALGHFSTNSEWKEFNWEEKFKNAEFNVDIDIEGISSLLLTKT